MRDLWGAERKLLVCCLVGVTLLGVCVLKTNGHFHNPDFNSWPWRGQHLNANTWPWRGTRSNSRAQRRQIFSGQCNAQTCQLPECRCEGSTIPGEIPPEQVPQMVMLTFDDGVNIHNFDYYRQLGLLGDSDDPNTVKNPNGCPARATFFVSGDNTDMKMVKALADKGNEIASHTITHGNPLHEKWNGSTWERQVQGMRVKLAQGIGRPVSEIRGMRSPYLELGGEDQYSMLQKYRFLYDSSMNGGEMNRDPVWPFTLRYPPSSLACDHRRCPKGSYPKLWEVPIVYHFTPDGRSCPMGDACDLGGLNSSKQEVLKFLRFNFNRSYLKNRAPYMVCLHATWFSRTRGSFEALQEFLHALSRAKDVWLVTVTQMLEWVQNPLPLSRLKELTSWQC